MNNNGAYPSFDNNQTSPPQTSGPQTSGPPPTLDQMLKGQ